MKFSYLWLKELIPTLPPPEKLTALVARHAFEVEGMEKRGRDTILDVAVFANRLPDAGGHIGFARELAAITKRKGTFPAPKLPAAPKKKFLDVSIKPADLSRRYLGALVSVKIQPSPAWLRERLEALGINTINNVVDITNYVMLESGHPLHAFDYEKIRGKRMSIRLSRDGETIGTLDGTVHALPDGAIVIDDAERAIDLAGIMGGANSAVSNKTETIFLQAASFEATRIHRASAALGVRTEAARRYGAGLDPNTAETALALSLELLKELAAGEVLGILDIYPKREPERRIVFHPEKANRVLGTDIAEKEMRAIFERLLFRVESTRGGWFVTAPTARRDIGIEEDLIEEVGRLHGYDAIREAKPVGELAASVTDTRLAYRDRTLAAFCAAGFTEVRTYSFIGERGIELLSSEERIQLLELENPQSRDAVALRSQILPSLLGAVREAVKFTSPIRYVESSRVFRRARKTFRDTTELEEMRMAFAIALRAKKSDAVFYELKGSVDAALRALGLADVWYDDVPASSAIFTTGVGRLLHPYQAAEVKIGGASIGMIGALHPEARRAFDIPLPAAAGELYLDAFTKELESEKEYRPIPKYPAILRDIAVLVPKDVRMTEVEDCIQNAGGSLLADADLFDAFEGDEIEADKKNLAFHLVFQSDERTLRDGEVEKLMASIKKALEANPDWEVR